MINIAIIEDEASDRTLLKSFVKKYEDEYGESFKIYEFENGINFITNYAPIYDIALIDIQMPHMDGMEMAEKLREIDSGIEIVFITNMSNYAVKGYSVDAVDFIVKPVQYYSFAAMLKKVLRLVGSKSGEIVLKTPTKKVRVNIDSISHVEVLGHQTIYYTDREEIAIWGTLKQQSELLPEDRFVKCNNYCIVNLKHVDSVLDGAVIVKGKNIPISRSKKAEVTEKLLAFYGKYM